MVGSRYFLVCTVVIAVVFSTALTAQGAPKPRVLAFYVAETEPDHVQFAQQALRYFEQMAKRDGFAFDSTADWSRLSDNSLKGIRLVLWLNGAPTEPEHRAAFEKYMRNGGAWLGFHYAGYNDDSTHWPWFVDFMGGAVFYNNSWPPMPAKLVVDSPSNAMTAGLPESFVAPNNEWYMWKPSPRLDKDVRVLLTLDPANYPLGLKGVLTQGDLPVAWTNTRYKMVYMNMGHGNRIFSSAVQNHFAENATKWLLHQGSLGPVAAPQTRAPEAAATEISLRGIAVNPKTHQVYAVNRARDTVTVVDAVARTVRFVKVGSGPEALAIDSVSNKIYVANTAGTTVSVIDGSKDEVTATVQVGESPYAIAVDPATEKVYVSKTFGHAMVVIDGKTNATNSLPEGMLADLIAVDPATNQLYLVNYEDEHVAVLDAKTNAVKRVAAGGHIWGAAVDAAANRAYFSLTGDANVAAVDGRDDTVRKIRVGEFPCALAVDGADHRLYVANYADDTVSVIDTSKNSVIATVPTVKHPQAIAIDAMHRRVYVASMVANEVAVMDADKNSTIRTLQVSERPYAIAVDPQSKTAFVAGLEGEGLMLIDETTFQVSSASELHNKQ